jgi:hypothetical protein
LEELSHCCIAISDLTQHSNERHTIHPRSIKLSLAGSGQNEVSVPQAAGVCVFFRRTKDSRINIHSDNVAVRTDLLGDAYGEAARTASDVRDTHPPGEEKTFEDKTVDSIYREAPGDRDSDETESDET